MGLYSNMTRGLTKRENFDTDAGRTPCADEGRDWSDASTSQKMPKVSSEPLV